MIALILHRIAGQGFPAPWVDEVDFLEPAAQLARHGTLRVPPLLAPEGMFWLPDLFTFLLAPIYRVFPTTIDVARWCMFGAVVGSSVGFWVAARRAGARPGIAGALVGVWLCMPRVVVMGNVARHEAVVVFFLAWALAATFSGRRVLALSLAALAALTHPAGVVYAVVVAAANLRRRDHKPTLGWEWAVVAAVVALVLFELAHFGSNAAIAVEQLRFQLERKAGRPSLTPPWLLGVITMAVFLVSQRVRDRAGWQSALLVRAAFCGYLVSVIGVEMWYEVLGVDLAILLLALAFLVSPLGVAATAQLHRVIAASLVAALLVPIFYASPWHGMRIGTRSDEWNDFVADVRHELRALSEKSDRRRTVVLSSFSGLPWPVEADAIGQLELYKETEAVRANRPFDYFLFVQAECCEGAPGGTEVFKVDSTGGNFHVVMIKDPTVEGRPYWDRQ